MSIGPGKKRAMQSQTSSLPAFSSKSLCGCREYKMNGRVSVGLVEVRAEVIWGRVYFVNLDATTIFTRNGDIEDYTGFMGGVLHMPPTGGPRVSWVRDEGYLDCVINTAELIANRAHVEYLRVDIFLNRGNPNGCMVNEISLTSGYV